MSSWLNYSPVVHWPLSGSVSQDIQASLLAQAGNDETELRVLREVASYGKQIGVLSDLVLALAAQAPKKLGAEGDKALEQLRCMAEDIERIKKDQRPLPQTVEEARALQRALKERFPDL